MLLNAFSGRTARLLRLLGLAVISWTVFGSDHAPATSGRGLVVLVAYALAVIAWLVWTLWSCRQRMLTPDLFVLAACGGMLTAATPNSASSALTFVAAVAAAGRVGALQGLTVAATGAAVLAAGAIFYDSGGIGVLAYALGFAASVLGGGNIRQTELRAEQAELLLAQTQRSHEEQLRAARLEESARIARDIHDVLAHSLAGLAIQLEATDALLAQGAEVEMVRERVQRAHMLAREGLQETRRAVGALRGDPVLPAPDAIAALVKQYEGEVRLGVTGERSRLSGPVGETVVRVIQEALTNIRKHAPGAEVSVTVAAGQSAVEVSVVNRALSPVRESMLADSGGGYGLRGMRERAAQLGGTLTAGPTAEGWTVTLYLPLEGR